MAVKVLSFAATAVHQPICNCTILKVKKIDNFDEKHIILQPIKQPGGIACHTSF